MDGCGAQPGAAAGTGGTGGGRWEPAGVRRRAPPPPARRARGRARSRWSTTLDADEALCRQQAPPRRRPRLRGPLPGRGGRRSSGPSPSPAAPWPTRPSSCRCNWRGEPVPLDLVDEALGPPRGRRRRRRRLAAGAARGRAGRAARRGQRPGGQVPRVLAAAAAAWRPVTESRAARRALRRARRAAGQGRPHPRRGPTAPSPARCSSTSRPAASRPPHLDDLRFYALLETLRLGTPPRRLGHLLPRPGPVRARGRHRGAARGRPSAHRRRRPPRWSSCGRQAPGPPTGSGPACRWCGLRDDLRRRARPSSTASTGSTTVLTRASPASSVAMPSRAAAGPHDQPPAAGPPAASPSPARPTAVGQPALEQRAERVGDGEPHEVDGEHPAPHPLVDQQLHRRVERRRRPPGSPRRPRAGRRRRPRTRAPAPNATSDRAVDEQGTADEPAAAHASVPARDERRGQDGPHPETRPPATRTGPARPRTPPRRTPPAARTAGCRAGRGR